MALRAERRHSSPSARWARAIAQVRAQLAAEREHVEREKTAREARRKTMRLRRRSSSSRSYFDLFCDAEVEPNEVGREFSLFFCVICRKNLFFGVVCKKI